MYKSFIFEQFTFDQETKTLVLEYSLDEQVHFVERYVFDFPIGLPTDQKILERAFFGLWVMAGISYFKTYLPPEIRFKSGGLSQNQQAFFSKTYLNGLGQLFVENNIDPQDIIHFPVDSSIKDAASPYSGEGDLVSVGGGKDSLLSMAILEAAGKKFTAWSLGVYPFYNEMLEEAGADYIGVRRIFDSSVKDLPNAYNGHVPISAIWAFAGVCAAILSGKNNVIVSNESSANEGNLEYHGMIINHQYSKTLSFEQDFQGYLRESISPDIGYFSLLRPLTELRIAKLFCKKLFDRYAGKFSSCNRNFVMSNEKQHFIWCGQCPKCAFIFLIFAPFIQREKLISLFGKNLFADEGLRATFEEILGRQGYKPFECVGEIDEARLALSMAYETGDWPELGGYKPEKIDYDYRKLSASSMPADYEAILLEYLHDAR